MKEFMVEFTITGDPKTPEYQAKVPDEIARIDELLASGELTGFWVKEDHSGGYFIAYQENEACLGSLFDSLPLKHELAFKTYPLKDLK